jgi:hypothetical protein
LKPNDILQTTEDISVARLSSYHKFFGPLDSHQAYGVYCWNEALSATLFRLISITEIVLRNKFHIVLSSHSYSPLSIGRETANDWYNHIDLSGKSRSKVENVTHFRRKGKLQPKDPAPSSNDVVSQMSFGFWPNLLNTDSLPWSELIPKIIPNHRYPSANHWKKLKNQDALYARLDLVNKLRNRIAHFEPIWKQGVLREERRGRPNYKPKIVLPAPSTPNESIERLTLVHDRVLELLKWLSPERHKDYSSSYVHMHFKWLCCVEGLNSYKNLKPGKTLPLSKFKRELNSITRRQEMVRVKKSHALFGCYYPVLH